MRMAYWTRILIGLLLGGAALVALWLTLGVTWATATAAALLAPVGFLGSYFIWSADRPEEGYEQVLFDRPNTIVSAVLLVSFALLGVGTGFLGGDAGPVGATVAEDLQALRSEYRAIADDHAAERVDAGATIDRLLTLQDASALLGDRIEALPDGEPKLALTDAHDALSQAMIQLKECASGRVEKCESAAAAEAESAAALARWESLRG